MIRYRCTLAALLVVLCIPLSDIVGDEPQKLLPAETPADNPLKGLVPYADAEVERFPHSLEFDYARLAGEHERCQRRS